MGYAPAASPPLWVIAVWWSDSGDMKVWGSGLGLSWLQVGGVLEGIWLILPPSWGLWESFWLQLEGLGGFVGPSWLQVGGHGSILAVLVPSWPSCWGVLGSFWFQVGGSWLQVEGLGGHLRVMLGVCWGYVGASWSSFVASYINLCCKSFDFEKVPKV